MALREIRRPWTRQPQGADVRLADWVGGRMLALTVGGNVPPAPLLYAGSGGPAQATPDGLALAGAAEVSGPGNGQLLHGGGQPLTCLAMVRVLSGSGGAGNTCVFSGPSGASSGDIVGIARGGYVWQFQARNDYGGPFVQQAWTTDGATAQPIAGRVFLLVGRALSATDTRLTTLELTGKRRRDETIDTTNTGSLVFDEWGTATLGRDGHDQLLYSALISGWAISDEQISELHANPWALFAPRRIWVPRAAAGGGDSAATLAATESGADAAGIAAQVASGAALGATESGADSAALIGGTSTLGALAAEESGSDTADAAAAALATGDMAALEAGDDTATGWVRPRATGAIAATEAGDDTADLAGSLHAQADLAATEAGADTATMSAATAAVSDWTLAATETGADSAAGLASVAVAGSVAATETGADVAALAGAAHVLGALAATEAGSDAAAIATSTPAGASATGAAQEAGIDLAGLVARVDVSALVAAHEAAGDDAATFAAAVRVSGAVSATESGGDSVFLTTAQRRALARYTIAAAARQTRIAAHARTYRIRA